MSASIVDSFTNFLSVSLPKTLVEISNTSLLQNTTSSFSSTLSSSIPSASSSLPAQTITDLLDPYLSVPFPNILKTFWSSLIAHTSPFSASTWIPLLVLFSTQFLLSFPLLFLEKLNIPLIRKYKIQKSKFNGPAETAKCVKWLFIEYFLVMFPMEVISFPIFKQFLSMPIEPELIPNWYTFVGQIVFCLFMEDMCHYFAHRALHIPSLYKYIHSMHHEFYAPYGLAASYAHPIEVILLGMCTFSGAIVLRPHIVTFLLWAHIRQYAAIETHCGYDFPFSPNRLFPCWAGALYHDFHHSHRQSIFASNFTWWDSIFGTNTTFLKYRETLAKKRAIAVEKHARNHDVLNLDEQLNEQGLEEENAMKEIEEEEGKMKQE